VGSAPGSASGSGPGSDSGGGSRSEAVMPRCPSPSPDSVGSASCSVGAMRESKLNALLPGLSNLSEFVGSGSDSSLEGVGSGSTPWGRSNHRDKDKIATYAVVDDHRARWKHDAGGESRNGCKT